MGWSKLENEGRQICQFKHIDLNNNNANRGNASAHPKFLQKWKEGKVRWDRSDWEHYNSLSTQQKERIDRLCAKDGKKGGGKGGGKGKPVGAHVHVEDPKEKKEGGAGGDGANPKGKRKKKKGGGTN